MRATERGKIAGGAMRQRGLCARDIIRDGRHLNACFILARTQDLGQHIQLLVTRAQLQICAACIIPDGLTGNNVQQKVYMILCIATKTCSTYKLKRPHLGRAEAGCIEVRQPKLQVHQPRKDGHSRQTCSVQEVGDDLEGVALVNEELLALCGVVHLLGVLGH